MSTSPEGTFVHRGGGALDNEAASNFRQRFRDVSDDDHQPASVQNIQYENPIFGESAADDDCSYSSGRTPIAQRNNTTTCDSIEDIPRSNESPNLGVGGGRMTTAGPYSVATNGGGYLIAVHRKLSRRDTYFLSYHKTRPSLFGVPLLIPCYEAGTNKDLYCAVWVQVARLLSPLPSTPPDQSNHATDW